MRRELIATSTTHRALPSWVLEQAQNDNEQYEGVRAADRQLVEPQGHTEDISAEPPDRWAGAKLLIEALSGRWSYDTDRRKKKNCLVSRRQRIFASRINERAHAEQRTNQGDLKLR